MRWLAGQWERFVEVLGILWPMRFPTLVLLVSIPFLWLSQSQDALLAVVQNLDTSLGNPQQRLDVLGYLAFVAFWSLWSFSTFYWARFMSRLPRARPCESEWGAPLAAGTVVVIDKWLPRLLGGAVIVVVLVEVLHAILSSDVDAACTGGILACTRWLAIYPVATAAIMLAAYICFVLFRRQGLRALGITVQIAYQKDLTNRLGLPASLKLALLIAGVATLVLFTASAYVAIPSPRILILATSTIWIVLGFVVLYCGNLPASTKATLAVYFAAFYALFLIATVLGWTEYLNSPAIIMSAFASWTFIGTFFLAYPAKISGLPTTLLLVIVMTLSSCFGNLDNHAVRELDDAAPPAIPIATALAAWRNQAPVKKMGDAQATLPIILVSTAGGASRAGYWTAIVLGELERLHPGFYRRLFSISSVSGGTLGALVYRALLNDLQEDFALENCASSTGSDVQITPANLGRCARAVVGRDFLAATLLAGIYSDFPQRLLPGALLPDRATALEVAWENAWHDDPFDKAHPSVDLKGGFHTLWSNGPHAKRGDWLPALLINGTSVKSGRRIITSNLEIRPDQFPDAIAFFGTETSREIRISTAIHNSARFPYIDAAGTLSHGGDPTDRIVDGGYFENFGASTSIDLLETLDELNRARPDPLKLEFFVIQISSDPALKDDKERDEVLPVALPRSQRTASDATAPPLAFWDTRDGLGYRATNVLRRRVREIQGDSSHYFHFRLTNQSEPMSWMLSSRAAGLLEHEWCQAYNQQQHDALAAAIGWPAGDPSCRGNR